MKNKVILRFILITVIVHGILIMLPAQEGNRNMLQVKYNINYFKGYKPSLYHGLFYPDISYKRFFKDKQRFVEFEFDNLSIWYKYPMSRPSDLGKVFFRHHYILESKLGSYLIATPRLSFMVKAGVAYRFGREARIEGLFYKGATNQTYKPSIITYRYRDFGLGASFEFLYRYGHGERWYLTLEAGGRRFLIRKITTKQQLYASLGVGYAF